MTFDFRLGRLRLTLFCVMFLLFPSMGWAATSVRLVASQHDPGCQMLRQFLRDRGFLMEQSKKKSALVIYVQSKRRVRMVYRREQRLFRLPKKMNSPRTRARTILSMAETFLEEARVLRLRKRRKARLLAASSKNASEKKRSKKVKLALAVKKKQAMNLTATGSPQQPSAKTSDQVKKVASIAKPKKPSKPKSVALKPAKRRPAPRKPLRRKARKVAMTKATVTKKRTPVSGRLWGRVLRLELGLGASSRLGNTFGSSWGGTITAGLLLWDWTIRLEFTAQSFWLQQQETLVPVFRAMILGGWRAPLQRWTKRWELFLLGGVVLAPYMIEQVDGARGILHLGVAVGVQGQFLITPRWSVFLRYAGSFFFLGYEPDASGDDRKAYPAPWQNSLLLGIQARF